jgi:hypothetical protein
MLTFLHSGTMLFKNALFLVLEGKLACTSIPLLCKVIVGNVVVFVLERKISFSVQ